MIDHQDYAPIGCHFHLNDERKEWEISLFVSRTEIVGGPQDGTTLQSSVQLDIVHVMQLFDSAPAVYWQSDSICEEDQLGQHVSFEGIVRGQNVWLRVLKCPPEWSGPGRLINATSGSIEDQW